MNKLAYFLSLLFIAFSVRPAYAATQTLLITQVSTGSLVSASDEFIGITNVSSATIDLTGYVLQYFAASATSFGTATRTIQLSGSIASGQTLFAASSGSVAQPGAQWSYSATLAASGGHVRLAKTEPAGTTAQLDVFGWGTALQPETEAMTLQATGVPYERQKSGTAFKDTNNNKNDFTPITASAPVAVPEDPAEPIVAAYPISITELLPDPASPLTDANDEYVELYNYSTSAVNLAGVVLQTGATFSYTYTFEQEVLPAFSYKVFASSKTKTSLSNTAGAVRLVAPSGEIIDEVAPYEKAPTGQSWTLLEDAWQWAQSSPGSEGEVLPVAVDTPSTASSASSKTTKSTKASTKAATTKIAAKTKTAPEETVTATTTAPPKDTKKFPVNPLILAGVGTFAVVYMVYEYRKDLFARFKRPRTNSAASRQVSS